MATLAIKGHATQGSEVIELLKMLGGIDNKYCFGNSVKSIYYIGDDGCIEFDSPDERHIVLTLEEFLEKFPYKVGDKVVHKNATSCATVYEIEKLRWESNRVEYTLRPMYMPYCKGIDVAENLQLYIEQKEETMEENKTMKYDQININSLDFYADKAVLNLPDGFEFKIEDEKVCVVKKKPQHPKNYEECLRVFGYMTDMTGCKGYKNELLESLQELIICRDAYWKIAGDWKPDWNDSLTDKYVITSFKNEVVKDLAFMAVKNSILAFPTEEMRDAFYENFKDLIEECKELL